VDKFDNLINLILLIKYHEIDLNPTDLFGRQLIINQLYGHIIVN